MFIRTERQVGMIANRDILILIGHAHAVNSVTK